MLPSSLSINSITILLGSATQPKNHIKKKNFDEYEVIIVYYIHDSMTHTIVLFRISSNK